MSLRSLGWDGQLTIDGITCIPFQYGYACRLLITLPPSLLHLLGRAQSVSLRSLGWDGQLTIDGITCIPFNFGVQGIVEVGSEPGDTLRTMDFEARPHIQVSPPSLPPSSL